MANNNQNLFAPPTEEELTATKHFAPPTEEELKATEHFAPPTEEELKTVESFARPAEEEEMEEAQSRMERLGSKLASIPKLPGYIIEEAPKEFSKAIEDPALAAEVLTRNVAEGASIVGATPKTSAAYEKYAVAPGLDKFRTLLSPLLGRSATDQDVQEFFTKWVPERYESKSIADLATSSQARAEAQNEQLPLLAGTGQGFGMLPGIVTGGGALKAAGVGSKLLQGGLSTAANVFPRSFVPAYEKTGDLSEATIEATEDAVLAGTLDVATRGLAAKGSKLLKPEVLKRGRDIMARRALGGTPAEQPRLEKLQTQIGEQMFPEGGPKLMGPLTTKAQLAKNIKSAANVAGKEIERTRQVISDAGENLVKNVDSPNPTKVGGADVPVLENNVSETLIPKQIIDPVQERALVQKIASQSPEIQAEVQKLLNPMNLDQELTVEFKTALEKKWPGASERIYNDLINKNQIAPLREIKQPTLENFFKNRQFVDEHINFEKQLLPNGRMAETLNGKALKIYRDLYNEKLMSRAQRIDQVAGTKAFDTLKEANDRYHILETISKPVSRAVNKQQSTLARTVMPATIGSVATGAGALVGGGPLAVGLAGLTAAGYGVKTFGNQFASNSLNLLHQLVTKSPQVLGKYAAPLQEAASRSSGSLAALNFALYSRDPEYRSIIDPLKEKAEKEMEPE